ncbi:LCP family protein [Catelliglobosispora koreensis]|uniref:LCP family protein n=1 Tax=Catelliglobosispora koreensis TaxID=129052 RepID=UPI0003749845|nr:LCP family protein [Catelliglobosispora koreensis]
MRASRSMLWPKIFLGLGLALVLVATAAFAGMNWLVNRYEASVTRDVLLAPSARGTAPGEHASWLTSGRPLNFLLIGSDWREGQPHEGQRADTIIIVQLNGERTAAHLVSIPRDLVAEIPEFPATEFYGSTEKINAAFHHGGGGTGGVQLLSATLAQLLGIRFDGAAVIDFSGMENIVNLLGGVRMCVDTEVTSIHTGELFPLGCQIFTGAQALDYSRQRYGLESGDYDRQRHNQQLLKAIFSTALSNGVAQNPLKIDHFIRALGASLTLDTGGASLADVLLALRGLRPERMSGVTVPSYPDWIGAESVILLSEEAPALFEAMQTARLSDWAALNPQWAHSL